MRIPCLSILFISFLAGCASTQPMSRDEEAELRQQVFAHLCKNGRQIRKVEVSWTAKVDSFPGQRLDLVQERQAKQWEEIQRDAKNKFSDQADRYSLDAMKDYLATGKINPKEFTSFIADQYILLIPQLDHIDYYDEACLPQYDNSSSFLGFKDGKPVLSALSNNRRQIWGCYARRWTTVLQDEEKFTARLDLNGFCRFARDASQLEAR